jgi:hypothetical protein
MTQTAKALLGFLIAALIAFAWLFRYDVQTGPSAYVTDRWTGTVYYCFGGCTPVDVRRP